MIVGIINGSFIMFNGQVVNLDCKPCMVAPSILSAGSILFKYDSGLVLIHS
jgi:hypothetical protein